MSFDRKAFVRKYLPYQQFVLYSPLEREKAAARLQSAVSAPMTLFERLSPSWEGYQTLFIGEAMGYSFHIYRNIRNRNSWLPVADGWIAADGLRSKVQVTLRLHGSTLVFQVIWFGFLLLFAVLNLLAMLLPDQFVTESASGPMMGMIAALGMVTFGYVVMRMAFGIEAKIAREKLIEIFDAEDWEWV